MADTLPVLVALLTAAIPFLFEREGSERPPGAPDAISGIVLTASLSEPEPAQYSTVLFTIHVRDHQQRPVPGATVTATAHYKTTTTRLSAVTDDTGAAELRFRISGATPGYRVEVELVAVKGGHTDSTTLSFTPRSSH